MNNPPLILGKLVKRYKRFFADIQLKDNSIITAHCVNTGSMLGCLEKEAPVGISVAKNPNRKLKFTLEIIKINGVWVGVNTSITNHLAEEFIRENAIPEIGHFLEIKREVKYGDHSRIDFLLTTKTKNIYIEVKNVSMVFDGKASFPDAVTTRGVKHLQDLINVVQSGDRGVMLFICQREDATKFEPAVAIDPIYAKTLTIASKAGVEIFVYKSKVSIKENKVLGKIPYQLVTES
jgi:sugar fermentation stimulation protein A